MTEREQWLADRRKGLGGSDAAVVCNLSPWKSPYQLFMEKTGAAEDTEDNEPMFWGRTLEPLVRQRYADVTGRVVTVPPGIITSEKYPWMIANVDGLAGAARVLEIKTSRMGQGFGEPGTDEIPEPYILQVQHYMVVCELPTADVAVLVGGNDFRIYEVPADPELQELLIEREREFWEMVQRGEAPEPTTFADIKAKYGAISKAVTVQATDQVVVAIHRLKQLKELAKEEEELKATVMGHLGEADTLVRDGETLATWKLGKPGKRFDGKALKAGDPETYEKFCKETAAIRRLLIK